MAQYRIPYVNIPRQHAAIKNELLEVVADVLEGGQFILGKEVESFEALFAGLCGTRFAVGVNSGTDALILALRSLGIGQGDEVITVPNSFVATTSSIVLVGAKPVFVDVRDDYNMNPEQIEKAVTARTKAILPVHLTGRPVEMKPIVEIAKRKRLAVIEDCAQAVLAEYHGRRVGSFGDAGCFSLHPLKNLNACGDGGAITINDKDRCQDLKVLRNLGLERREDCVVWSGNSRLDSIQSAVLMVKMRYVEGWTARRRRNAGIYREGLQGIRGIQAPVERPHEKHVYHTFVVQAEGRDELKAFLAKHGVETAVHYPIPIHLQTVGRSLGYERGSFPVAERQAETILSLPIYPELEEETILYIVEKIRSFYRG